MKDRLKEIEKELSELESREKGLREERYQLRLQASDIAVGMKVRGEKGQIFQVTGAHFGSNSTVPPLWLKGCLVKKDGTLAKRESSIFYWMALK